MRKARLEALWRAEGWWWEGKPVAPIAVDSVAVTVAVSAPVNTEAPVAAAVPATASKKRAKQPAFVHWRDADDGV